MFRAISSLFKIFSLSWSIASGVMSFTTTIVLFFTRYISVVLVVGIPVLAIVGIYHLVKNKNDKNLNGVDENSNDKITTEGNIEKVKKKYNVAIDILMIIITSGLWIIWMIFRPKYEK